MEMELPGCQKMEFSEYFRLWMTAFIAFALLFLCKEMIHFHDFIKYIYGFFYVMQELFRR